MQNDIGFLDIYSQLKKAKKAQLQKVANLLDIDPRTPKVRLRFNITTALGVIYDDDEITADEGFSLNRQIYEILKNETA